MISPLRVNPLSNSEPLTSRDRKVEKHKQQRLEQDEPEYKPEYRTDTRNKARIDRKHNKPIDRRVAASKS